jgi:pyridoxamine 5'-phosphate oxidase
MNELISKSRIEYLKGSLDESLVEKSPFDQFGVWFEEAHRAEAHEANACGLATVGADGQPSLRMVLLKSFDSQGFVFFSNYSSRKGKQLGENPKAALCFYWPSLERQVRLEGLVEKVTPEESDRYFENRPRESQFGSAVSAQSRVASSRQEVEEAMSALKQRVGDGPVPRPQSWGGYRLKPSVFEFWQGRENRLHDRIRYSLVAVDTWSLQRLWP